MCAASDKSAKIHENGKVGNLTINHIIRVKLIKEIIRKFNYQRLILIKPEYVKNIHKKYIYGKELFNLNDTIWKDVNIWQ